MKGIRDRVALITGGASGIGAGLVLAFEAAGAKVAFVDIQDEEGQKLQQQIGSQCLFVSGDLRRDADIDRIVDTTASTFGGIDFLINAAATYADKGADSDRAMWQNGFDTNLFGHVMLTRRAHDHLKRSAWPSITYFTSESAHVGLTGRWIYPATKAAIEQVTRSQALDLAPDKIRVNAVMPGWTEKPWHKTAPARNEGALRYDVESSSHDRPSRHSRGGGRCGAVPLLGARWVHHRKLPARGRRALGSRPARQGKAPANRSEERRGGHLSSRRALARRR